MTRWVVLLRGINVGGRNKLPMADLKSALVALGCSSVSTYIQSGNAVISASQEIAKILPSKLPTAIEKQFGFSPNVLVIDAGEFRHYVEQNPYNIDDDKQNTLHLFICDVAPPVDAKQLDAKCGPTEDWRLIGNVLYLHAPDGIGRSRFAPAVERLLGVPTTARNLKTALALLTKF